MNARMDGQKLTIVSTGAIPEVCTNVAVLLTCAALATLAVTAALLLALPMVPEALATSGRALDAEVAYVDERSPGQVIADWVDAVSEREFARSRLRSSD